MLDLGNKTAGLILTRGGLGLGAVALWGAHARQMSETAMSILLFCFVFGPVTRVFCRTKALRKISVGVSESCHAGKLGTPTEIFFEYLGPSAGKWPIDVDSPANTFAILGLRQLT